MRESRWILGPRDENVVSMSELRLEPNAAGCDDRQFMGDSGRKGAVVELDTRVERQDAGIRGAQIARWRLVVVGILARPGHAIGDAEMAPRCCMSSK